MPKRTRAPRIESREGNQPTLPVSRRHVCDLTLRILKSVKPDHCRVCKSTAQTTCERCGFEFCQEHASFICPTADLCLLCMIETKTGLPCTTSTPAKICWALRKEHHYRCDPHRCALVIADSKGENGEPELKRLCISARTIAQRVMELS